MAAAAGAKEQNVSDLQGLIARTAALPACRFIIDCNDDRFINPASMSAEIRAACRDAGQPVPESDAELARCIFDSPALLYARVLNELAALRGRPFSQLHIVGGGCQNTLLNQLCADACGIAVVAGPIEASTLGNIGIQLMTLDELANVDEFRQVVRGNAALTTLPPILIVKLPVSWRSFSHNRPRSFAHDHQLEQARNC